jgi:hypothetical protein
MEHKQYEALKELCQKVVSGTSTFAERNVLNIIQKQKKRGKVITVASPKKQ